MMHLQTNLKKPPKLKGYTYSYEEAIQSRDNNEILTIRLETSLKCNLRCKYCCNKSGRPLENEISFEKIIHLVDESRDLGAKSIVIIGGGEPTIYDHFQELVSYINNKGLIPVVFTNTQTITKELASFLYLNNASVIIKLDSLTKSLQDELVGVQGAYERIQKGLSNLIYAGYGAIDDEELRLGASFVVSKYNCHEVFDIWRFCRTNHMFPNLEMMIPNGNAKDIIQDCLTAEEWKKLKDALLYLDQSEYGYTWFPYTPLVGASCFQVIYNLYIAVNGDVRPCSSIHCHEANINLHSLKEILELPFFQIARNIDKHLTGNCGRCNMHNECIGCRGLAYSVNSENCSSIDALCSSDPSCLYNTLIV